MTVGTAKPSVEYVENGVTLTHPIPFQFFDQDELIVIRTDGTADANTQTLRLGVDYTVQGGGGDVGSITKTTGGVVGATLGIHRHTHRSQLLDYEPGDEFPAESHEEGLDRLEMQIQELEDEMLDEEKIRDIIGKILRAGPGIKIDVDDARNIITISALGALEFPDCVMLSGDQQHWVGDGTPEGAGGLSSEDVEDIVASMIKAGDGIFVQYNDADNSFTITNTAPGGQSTGAVSAEDVEDIVAGLLRGANGITLTYNDAGNILTIDGGGAGGGSGDGSGGLSVASESLNSGGGYYELSDGFMFQWGVVNVAGNGTPTIFYPKPFTTFGVPIGSGGRNGVNDPSNCRVVGSALNGFTVCNNDGNGVTFFWHAMGK